jgi:hypothetical protein
MPNCKATFELSKGNEPRTETRYFQFSAKRELFAQIRSYAVDTNGNGFNVNRVSTERESQIRASERPQGNS